VRKISNVLHGCRFVTYDDDQTRESLQAYLSYYLGEQVMILTSQIMGKNSVYFSVYVCKTIRPTVIAIFYRTNNNLDHTHVCWLSLHTCARRRLGVIMYFFLHAGSERRAASASFAAFRAFAAISAGLCHGEIHGLSGCSVERLPRLLHNGIPASIA
jgi:hypothetical protein